MGMSAEVPGMRVSARARVCARVRICAASNKHTQVLEKEETAFEKTVQEFKRANKAFTHSPLEPKLDRDLIEVHLGQTYPYPNTNAYLNVESSELR